jgi:hypothetical protein
MLVSDVVTGTTPLVIGVNLGHHYPTDGSWVAYMEHLGVNGARNARLGHCVCGLRRALGRSHTRRCCPRG